VFSDFDLKQVIEPPQSYFTLIITSCQVAQIKEVGYNVEGECSISSLKRFYGIPNRPKVSTTAFRALFG